ADRIARLERNGTIRGYRADLDLAALGAPLVVYVGAVAVQGSDQRAVVRELRALREVEDVRIVTGPQDMLIRMRVRDTEHLREALVERIWSIKGLVRTETYVSLDGMEPKVFAEEFLEDSLTSARNETESPTDGVGRGPGSSSSSSKTREDAR